MPKKGLEEYLSSDGYLNIPKKKKKLTKTKGDRGTAEQSNPMSNKTSRNRMKTRKDINIPKKKRKLTKTTGDGGTAGQSNCMSNKTSRNGIETSKDTKGKSSTGIAQDCSPPVKGRIQVLDTIDAGDGVNMVVIGDAEVIDKRSKAYEEFLNKVFKSYTDLAERLVDSTHNGTDTKKAQREGVPISTADKMKISKTSESKNSQSSGPKPREIITRSKRLTAGSKVKIKKPVVLKKKN